MADRPLHHRRLLLVEDNYILAESLRYQLEDEGAEIVGPAATVSHALTLLNSEPHIDGAVLDVNLGEQKVFPVADVLIARGVPFVFTTGYDRAALPPDYTNMPTLQKPVSAEAIGRALVRS